MAKIYLQQPGHVYCITERYWGKDSDIWCYNNQIFNKKYPSHIKRIQNGAKCILLDNIRFQNTKISRILLENGVAYIYSRHLVKCK